MSLNILLLPKGFTLRAKLAPSNLNSGDCPDVISIEKEFSLTGITTCQVEVNRLIKFIH